MTSAPSDARTSESFDSLDPATGDVVATFPLADADDVRAAVDRARRAARWWVQLGYAGRARRLRGWKRAIIRRIDELAELMHREGGKPLDDARLEIIVAVEQLDWATRNAARVLARRPVLPGLLLGNHSASVGYQPYGVVAVIGPWNYPVFTPMGSLAYALAAGNTVVFKPSEYTPAVGAWLAARMAEVAPEADVLQVVTGRGEAGAALCRAGVDKIAFTGSSATARKVLTDAAATLTPSLIECGGKDVLIVTADADLDAAADAAVWGGMSNAGQTCLGVERVYAVDAVYDEFLELVIERVRSVRAGSDADASYGPMTMPAQVDVVRAHVADALARGGRAVVGGPESVRPPYVDPVVLADVPEDSIAVREETFGPVLVVNRAHDADDAVALANGTEYGLGATVFGSAEAERVARRLRCGMVSINSVIPYVGMPALPFGGVGRSGFGRIHGADGLREFARAHSIARRRTRSPLELTSFRRGPGAIDASVRLSRLRHGRG